VTLPWELGFRYPWLLAAAAAALPVAYLLSRRTGRVVFSSLAVLPARGSSWRARFAWLPAALLALATVGLAIAAAGPRTEDDLHRIHREGIAIMMVVDTSGSMRALDLAREGRKETRLDAVKRVFEEFVLGGDGLRGRPDDAIGLVSFGGYADTRAPLTLDHEQLAAIARSLHIVTERAEDGTALGDGLGLAVERLYRSDARSKVAILLTDGVQNAGELSPAAAAELARTKGVKVYTVGAGTTGMAPVEVEDPFTGEPVIRAVPVEIDEETLQSIAAATGGRYFRATDADALIDVYREIDALERTDLGEDREVEYHEHYQLVLAVSLLLACLGWLGQASVFRRLPG
jgi:Ca-activated chloride channel family protein